MSRKLFVLLSLLQICRFAPAQPFSDLHPYRFYIQAGLYQPQISTVLRLDSKTAGIGTPVDLENDLGFKREAGVFRGDILLRLTPALSLTGSWFRLKRDATRYISRTLQIRDTVYEAGALVQSRLHTSFAGAGLQLAILNKEMLQAGLSLGVRWLSLDAAAEATSNGYRLSEAYKGEAPAPLPGAFVSFWPHSSIQLKYTIDYFSLSLSGISGRIVDNRLAAAWYPLRYAGVGASWSDTRFRVREIPFNDEFRGRLDYELSGFAFFVTARF